jgi:hypothetical protein
MPDLIRVDVHAQAPVANRGLISVAKFITCHANTVLARARYSSQITMSAMASWRSAQGQIA